jgi:DNA adenine methylase
MIAFAYYGGKQNHLKHILPILPEVDHFCETFCGSAAVMLNRKPSKIETLNDLNGDIVNFFRMLRDRPDDLIRKLELTPYAYEEFTNAWIPCDDEIERARRFYIRTQMDVAKAGNRKDKSWSCNKSVSSSGHSYCVKNFHSKVDRMYEVAKRLMNVQIDNRPAEDLIVKYDNKKTLFYCDPPYLPATRKSSNDYKFELSLEGHQSLAKVLNKAKGMVALSGYDHPVMDEMYKGWNKVRFPSLKVPMSRGKGLVRQECLWVNYPVVVQTQLFNQ